VLSSWEAQSILLFCKHPLSNDSLGPAWTKKPRDSPQQMGDEDEQV